MRPGEADSVARPSFATGTGPAGSGAQPPLQVIRALHEGLGEMVTLLMRDPRWRHASLADLEWLLLPPLSLQQIVSARGKVKDREGVTLPVGLGLWATVSPDVDAKLEAQKQAGIPPRLTPQDWKSGDICWLVVSVGPAELQQRLAEKLATEVLGGRALKRY
ncbi:toxin-activating lysine-acyltransferase [Pannonibacter sp. SL95]|uniref:toxin-activating lysine-acyltransferase n=1 Tax=Pannonibacter sp. SL95 TaxID=2995153 RepID=UPI0022724380|nr:toxin-activating lysine-acyltransferase [Pannonibacter sp. SL95]MCY1707282.1 toxin-activating lysine-acyltransferase [Pannonibacter sp. SL95]